MRPKIFISAVTRELGPVRQLAANALTRLGYDPVWQDVFDTESGDLRQVLQAKIDESQGVVHIAGLAYGTEPPTVDPEFGRLSYSQFELMYARKKEKKAWVVIIRKEYPFDDLTAAVLQSQKSDARELQDAWRERLQRGEFIWYAVASQVEFELVVSRLPIPKRVLATLAFKNVGCAMSITLMSLAVLSVVGVSYYIELRNERTELLTRIEQHEKRDLFAWTLSMSELKMLEEKRAELGEREWERQYGELLRKRLEQDRKSDFLTVITRQKVDRAIQALADAKMQLGNGNLDQASDSVDRAIELLDSVVGDKKSSGNFSDRLRRDLITPEKPSAPQ